MESFEEGFHSIEPKRLNFESSEFGLLRDAFGKAVERCRPLTLRKRKREGAHVCTLDCSRITAAEQEPLKRCAGQLAGTIPNTALQWSEALIIKLDFRLGRLWCLIEPAIYVPGDRTPQEKEHVESFRRERAAARYNRQWNGLLDAWAGLLVGSGPEVELQAFGTDEGVDAKFSLVRTTAFSRKGNYE